MGLIGFLRKGKRNSSGSSKRSKKGAEEGPTILPEPPVVVKAIDQVHQEGTNSTEPESSTHHETDGILTETVPPVSAAKVTEHESEEDSSAPDLEGLEDPSFEIVESPKGPVLTVDNNESAKDAKDEASILEKFKAKSPVRRGNKVAERAAWLQTKAFREEESKSASPVPTPVSNENARAKKMFWEGKPFPKETSNAPDPPSVRHRTDVLAKKKWLETVAFTPSGGGNMSMECEEMTPEKRKHTIGLLPASPVHSNLKDDDSGGATSRTAKDLIHAINSYEMQNKEVFLDKENDDYEWAYEVWHQKGLLSWRSASYADDEEVEVHTTVREDILSPSKSWATDSRDGNSSPQRAPKSVSDSPVSSPGMESVPENESINADKSEKEDTNELEACSTTQEQSESNSMEENLALPKPGTVETEPSAVIIARNSVDEVATSADVNLRETASDALHDDVNKAMDTRNGVEATETIIGELQARDDTLDTEDISAHFGSSDSPLLPEGPSSSDIIVSDSSVQSDADAESPPRAMKTLANLTSTPPSSQGVDIFNTSEEFSEGNNQHVKGLFEVQQQILRDSAVDNTATSPSQHETDIPSPENHSTPEQLLDDDDDEELKDLFRLQQKYLHQFRQESDGVYEKSDEESDTSSARGYIPPPQLSESAIHRKTGRKASEDSAESTDSSEKLRQYSKQYIGSEYTNVSRDVSADAESGIHLEPSVVTHASSITVEDISVGDAMLFVNSSFAASASDSSKDAAASFELANEEEFKNEMDASSHARGLVFASHTDHFAVDGPTDKDQAPAQPARQISTRGTGFGQPVEAQERETHTPASDHAPAQPSRKVSHEKRDLAPNELMGGKVSPVDEEGTNEVSRASDHAPAQPMRQISVEGQELVSVQEKAAIVYKHDTAPVTPVRVASMEALSPRYTSDSLQKLKAKKIAAAIRGQYVIWLTKSRSVNFRKTSAAPALSWFSYRSDQEPLDEEEKVPILIPFLSVPPRLRDKFRPKLLSQVAALKMVTPKRLSRVVESGGNNDELYEGETCLSNAKRELRDYISPRRRRVIAETMQRLESAKQKKSAHMRRAFGTAQKKKAEAQLHDKLTQIAVPDDAVIQDMFESIDLNDDAMLSVNEVEKAIIQRHFDLSPAVIMRGFEMVDANKNGYIDRTEFFQFVRCMNHFQNLLKIFEEMDEDGNRRLSREEFVKAAHVLNVDAGHAQEVFDEMDENKGGYVVFDEFCIWMAKKRALCDAATE